MARGSKEKNNLYNLKGKNKSNKKNKTQHKNRKITNKVNNKQHNSRVQIEDDIFSFEEEMIIGMKSNPVVDSKEKVKRSDSEKSKKNKKVKKKISQEQADIKKYNKKNFFKNAKYFAFITLFITLIIVTMFSPIFNIKNITIIGNEKITQSEILSLSGIQVGENTYKISKGKVKEKIKENAYIEDVIIKRKLPSQIEISIQERKTAFMIEYGASYVYINEQGYILEITAEKMQLPILQGVQTKSEEFIIGNRLENSDLQKMNTVLRIMEIAQSNEISNLITRIDIEDEKNYIITFEEKGKTAYIGDNSNLNTKILSIKAILEKTEGISGDILVNVDLNNEYPIFRQKV